MKTMFRTAALVVGCLSLGACTTAKHSSQAKQSSEAKHSSEAALQVRTTPAGASVRTSNGQSCEPTPCAIHTPAKAEFTATVSKPGYQSADVKVSHGLFGLKPKSVKLALKPGKAQQAANKASPPISSPSNPAPPPPLAYAQVTAAPQWGSAPAAYAQPAHQGRVIALRVLPDGSVLETHSPFN
jgi:hypothetical protein